ncbi:MAG: tetratricopeptide repeat protein [Gemmatimonadetes bacterium]|jgi:TolA-binding protein|nr:tetratricopeptide repeat protein [Gemmatimonadota bacterium]MBT4609521.1 tetratricopeptide repeat protein [Gemmatimonadota bacterium]MBT5058554.1 tetratricopeptide repeat protein [Gemmatimonadota bacterium]MBT5141116.1 tetratricopeptide repeat protein [Gemmatimonadota bacterium]MBT5591935.1 tetratricopeptide repeat protein [Gemmatimonadota bacterium]
MNPLRRSLSTATVVCRGLIGVGLLLTLTGFGGCSARQAELAQRLDTSDDALRADQETLRQELAALHRRLQLQADRLRRAEDELVRLRAEMLVAGERSDGLSSRSTRAEASTTEPHAVRASAAATSALDAAALYQQGRAHYGERRYDEALKPFARIVAEAQQSKEADNAQYWIGECYYGMGKFRQALDAFNLVLAYAKTEKDDDAQLKIARCHLSLGQKEQAIAAFRVLIETYPTSEYVSAAGRELRYLEGP